MKLRLLFVICISFVLYSCKSEYKKMDNGALMKYYIINNDKEMPEIGDMVIVDITQKVADSVLISSDSIGEPFEILLEEPSFVGDLMSALMNMHIGDHVSLIFPIDSLFESINETIPDFIEEGTLTEMDITLKDIIKKQVLEEEYRNELISRKNEEDLFLSSYFDSDKYMVTEDSLIVVEINKGKGRLAKVGDIMKVYFTFLTVDGDTLLDFQTGRPYELVFGDMALGRGFYEALSLISKGGHIECVIPSSLAFGKDGFYDAILPYTTFKLDLDVVDIMTSDEYEAEQEELMNKKLKEESRNIAKYLKDNNINVEPTSTGLYYIDTEVGSGDSAQIGDMVMVHYTIYNIDNEKIESSYDYNQPMTFIYGNNQMIPGIEEAVGYMKVGGKAKIIVPFQLGFGDIVIDEALPANSTLIVDLEFVGLQR